MLHICRLYLLCIADYIVFVHRICSVCAKLENKGILDDMYCSQARLVKVVNGLVNMLGDSMFNYPIDRMVKMQGR